MKEDLLLLLKNLLNPYSFNYTLAFEYAFIQNNTQKELKFIMYAQESDSKSTSNIDNSDYSIEIDDSEKKERSF